MRPTRRPALAYLLAAVLSVALGGCSAHPGGRSGGAPAGPAGSSVVPTRSPADSPGATFDEVGYTADTVVLSDASVHSGLLSSDGASFRFASGTAGLAAVAPGKVLLVSGRAVRKVTAVRTDGGDVVVQTTAANLNDAIHTGTIGWSRSVDWNAVPRSAYQHAALDSGLRPRTVQAGWVPAADPGTVSFGGTVAGFDVSLDLTPQSDGRLDFSMSAGRSNIKVTAKGWLSGFVSETRLVYQQGTGTLFDSDVRGLKGEATLEWSAIGVGSALDSDAPAFSLPFSIPVPIEVGPLPFLLTVKSTLRFAPALTSKSSSGGSFKVSYDSDFGFKLDGPQPDPVATVRDAIAALGDKETVTAAFSPVGFGWGFEFPPLELSLAGTGTFAYLTLDSYMAGEFTPGTTLTSDIPPCQRAEITVHAISGYKVALLGITAASDKTTLWEKNYPFYKDGTPCTLTGKP